MFSLYSFAILLGVVSAQLIIPPRPLGYVYNNGSNDAPIHLDVHMGPLCPDSQAAFPTIKQVADHYTGATVKLTLHMFPLPYHRQSYFTAIGAQVMKRSFTMDKAYCYFNEIYTHIDQLSNTVTMTMDANAVIDKLASMATFCGANKDQFVLDMKDGTLENNVRTAWKYTCTRGISGTPTFLINDIIVDADPAWTLAEWRQVIDPLLKQSIAQGATTCPVGTKRCEYLPDKIECCTHGEGCISNVGCRCFEEQQTKEETEHVQMMEIQPLV